MTEKVKRQFYPPPPGLGGPFKDKPVYSGILSNESPNHNNLRTTSVQGQFANLPEVGKMFTMVGEALTPEATMRYVNTSIVKDIGFNIADQTIVFETESGSTYRLDYSRIEEE